MNFPHLYMSLFSAEIINSYRVPFRGHLCLLVCHFHSGTIWWCWSGINSVFFNFSFNRSTLSLAFHLIHIHV